MKIKNNLITHFNLKEGHLTIPKTVVGFDETIEGLRMISSIKSITVEEGNPVYHAQGNCLIETATKTLVLSSDNSVIPDNGSVTTIGVDAFCMRAAVKTLNLPDAIETIEARAFNATGIQDVVLPPSITNIGPLAFMNCKDLKRIFLPSNIQEIGNGAFCGDYLNACEFVLDESNPTHRVENGCIIERATNKLVAAPLNAIIPEGVLSIGRLTFFGMWHCTEIYIPASVAEFEDDDYLGHPFMLCGGVHSSNLTIKSPKGSCAIKFAKNSNIKYIEL